MLAFAFWNPSTKVSHVDKRHTRLIATLVDRKGADEPETVR